MFPQIENFWCWLSLVAFVVVAIIHLVHSYKNLLGESHITKFILIPLLAIVYAVWTFLYADAVNAIHIITLVALLLFWIADMLLIFDWDPKNFAFGILLFFFGQVLYAVNGIMLFQNYTFPVLLGLIIALVYIVIFILKSFFSWRHYKHMNIYRNVYVFSVLIMSYIFLMLAIANPNVATIFLAVGGVFFLLSDSHVLTEYFEYGYKKSRFWIMFTYLVGQTLVILGFVGIQSILS